MPSLTVPWVYNLEEDNVATGAASLLAIAIVFPVVALVAIGLRFYIRLKSLPRHLASHDYAALSSLILGAAYAGLAIWSTRWGAALDPTFMPPQNKAPLKKLLFISGIVYCLSLLGFKLSLLICYSQVGGFKRSLKYALFATMALCTATHLSFALVLVFSCYPIARQWNTSLEGSCIDLQATYFVLGAANLILDVIIIVLPLPFIFKLDLPWTKKIGLAAMFLLGLGISLIQIVRLLKLKELSAEWDSSTTVRWTIIEVNLGVLVCCLPTYTPLINRGVDRLCETTLGRSDVNLRARPSMTQSSPKVKQSHETDLERAPFEPVTIEHDDMTETRSAWSA